MKKYSTYFQKGFSLVELLIAMTIGLFLLAGIATSYLSTKVSSVKRDQISSLEDNGSFALEVISTIVKHVGYTPVNTSKLPNRFIQNTSDVVDDTCQDGSKNVVNTSNFKVTNDDVNGDSLGVIYYGDNNIFIDCIGNELPVACRLKSAPLKNEFSDSARIYNSFFVDNLKSNLLCTGSRSARPQVIAEGIDNIQFLYGIDEDDNGLVDRYVNASSVGSEWENIVSVQVAVLVRSLKPVKPNAESKTFTLLDSTFTTPVDKFKRVVFSTTIQLRNRL